MRHIICHILFVAVCVSATGCNQIGAMRRGDTRSQSQVDASEIDRVLSIARLTERRGEASVAQKMYEDLVANGNALGNALGAANHRLGVMAAKNRDFERAWKHFDAAKANGLDSSELLADIGYARLLSGEFEAAEEMFEQALKRTPSDKRSLNNMAILRGAQGRFSESLAFSKKAVGSAKAQANLGYLLSQFGDADKAVKHYHLALNQDPSLKVAASALLQIEFANRAEAQMPPEVIATKPAAVGPVAKKSATVKPKLESEVAAAGEAELVKDLTIPVEAESPVLAVVAEGLQESEPAKTPPLIEVPVSVEIDEEPVAKPVTYVSQVVAISEDWQQEEADIVEDIDVVEEVGVIEEEVDVIVEEVGDEEVEAFFDRVNRAKIDAAKKAESLSNTSRADVSREQKDEVEPVGSSDEPRMSSRRRWSRSEFAGEARTISYFAQAEDSDSGSDFGFSFTRLPNVAAAE